MIVVIITITNAKQSIYLVSVDLICRHKANAITPRTIPEYQQTFNYLESRGHFFLRIKYPSGKRPTIIALIIGIIASTNKAIRIACHFPSIPQTDAPKYAKTKASAI